VSRDSSRVFDRDEKMAGDRRVSHRSFLSRARSKAQKYIGLRWGSFRRTAPVNRGWGFERGNPIDRHYIEQFLGARKADIRGHVLEVHNARYTRKFGGGRVTKSSVLDVDASNADATIITDLNDAIELPSAKFDCVILTQTLQFIYDVRAALRDVERSLAPGGVLLLTVPGLTRISERAGASWYWTFTRASVARLLKEYFEPSTVEVSSRGNVLAATAFLHGLASAELDAHELDADDSEFQLIVMARARKKEPA
jgi:SAM-dependent methyltransferase